MKLPRKLRFSNWVYPKDVIGDQIDSVLNKSNPQYVLRVINTPFSGYLYDSAIFELTERLMVH
jgi:hypothetical protein